MLGQSTPWVSTLRGPPRLRESERAGYELEPGVFGELRGAVVMGFSTSTYPSSQGVPLPPVANIFLLFSLCSGCSCGYCFVQRPRVAGDHGMKPGRSMWLGQRWRDQRGCVWELSLREG